MIQKFNHFPKTNYFNNTIGFELWEILTMMTIILSMATGIMWFTNFQPKQTETDLALLETQKHIVYNDFMDNQLKLKENYTQLNLSSECKQEKDQSDNSLILLDQEISKIQTTSQFITTEQKKLDQIVNPIAPKSTELMQMFDVYGDFLASLQQLRSDQHEFKKNNLRVNYLLNTLCQNSYSKSAENIASLDQIMAEIAGLDSKNMEVLQKELKQFTVNYKSDDLDKDRTDRLQQSRKRILDIQYNVDLFGTDFQKSTEDIVASFKTVENKEKILVSKNSNLNSKVVYIY